MQLNKYCIFLSLIFLAACGDNQASDATVSSKSSPSASSKPSSNKKQPIMMSVSGAEAFTFSYNTMFACNEDAITVATMSHLPKVQLVMPLNTESGEYELISYDVNNTKPDAPMLLVVGELTQARKEAGSSYGASYTSVSEGKLSIRNLPKAKGGVFDATLNGTLSDSKGNQIAVEIDFAVPNNGYCSL